ncbi:hypothetical protein [Intrasporangium calvum]|uniref:Peptidase inhibitor family I36 n=1 Tax=Intrasporangium calvum (strain ATCC 23552 / DSM 43043 / JCM 3097 / NBRC 12989 / NCIMB 10167 / NRRL B-3866 / 7 KIP) TaxID=710696 RepID=E6SC00_INTC7|nr:hypothetical protein [Intrasporangium calvum]ADU49540.1 hypothetical protein Intca_3053 [Intrasporangium calvum DSM 43043]
MSIRTRLTSTTTVLAALLLLGSTAAGAVPDRPTGPQREIDAYLRGHPGGVQVSDNAVAYRDGDVVVVFPDPGEPRAPEGLGANVRSVALATELADDLQAAAASYAGCPYGASDRWYCFYTDSGFGGRRLQFLNTCSDYASDWGFNNATSSWVNTNPDSRIVAWDYRGGTALWVEDQGISSDGWVGSGDNDRMSYWSRSNC